MKKYRNIIKINIKNIGILEFSIDFNNSYELNNGIYNFVYSIYPIKYKNKNTLYNKYNILSNIKIC